MPVIKNLNAATGADYIGSETGPALTVSNLSTGPGLSVVATGTQGASIAPLRVVQSAASGAFLSFQGAFISSASYGGTASTNAFVIPVYHETQRVFGYISAQKAL